MPETGRVGASWISGCDPFNLSTIIFFIGTPLTFLVTLLEAIEFPIGNGKVATKVKNGRGSQVQRLMMKPCMVATKPEYLNSGMETG